MNASLLFALAPLASLSSQANQASTTAVARVESTAQGTSREVAYFEIPDLQKLLAAYPRAPFVQMLADPAVRESATGLLESTGIELAPALTQALEQLGLPSSVAAAPLQALRGMAGEVRSASISLSLAGEPDAISDALGKTITALRQLQELQWKVVAHAEQNQGYPPDALELLDLPPELRRDPWGQPFELEVDLTTLEAQVKSLGADGAPGGAGFAADLSLANAAADLPDQIAPRAVDLIVEVGFVEAESRAVAQERALQLAAKLGWKVGETSEVTLGGKSARVRELRDPVQPQRAVWLLDQESRLVAGYGAGSLELALARSREVRRSAAPAPELTELARFLEEPSGATVAQGWMRLDPLERFLKGLERELEAAQPGTSIGHLPFGGDGLFRMRLDGDRFVTELVTQSARGDPSAPPPELDFLACVGAGPVPESLWSFVPAESIGVFATSLDGELLYKKILEALHAAGPEQPKSLAGTAKEHGFGLGENLIGNLGGGAAAYLLPASSLLLAWVGTGPVPESLLTLVPPESIGEFATSREGELLYKKMLEAFGAAGPEQPNSLAEMEKKHGFSLDKDLIGNLGGGAAAYLLPISSLTIPGVALVVELRDAERFRTGLDGLLKLLEEQASGEFTVRYKPYRDQPLWTFSFGEGAGPLEVSPSIAIVQDHLLITLTALRAKKEIKRLQEEPAERHRLLSAEGAPPAHATTIGYMDWPTLIDGSYEGARKALALMGSLTGELPFDPELLPAADTFTRFFQPTQMWSHLPAPGVRATRLESSFGPETWLGLIGGGGALALGVRVHQAQETEHEQVVVADADPERELAASQSEAVLSEVATRLEVFRIDVGHYPAKLAELLKPSANYPRGYMGQDALPLDGWGRSLVYRAAADGASYGLWSLGENGEDERGDGDDVRLP